nr:MAG TPA: hypothetical protein [Caudoviricetes sp.]
MGAFLYPKAGCLFDEIGVFHQIGLSVVGAI